MKFLAVCIILLNLLLTSCASRSARAQSQAEPVFSMTAKNADDQITLGYKDTTTTIDINSPFGVGSAKFTLTSGDMPEHIVVQLHLKGLEEFKLISAQNVVSASVPSGAGLKAQSQRKISGNSEQVIRSFDALWLDIDIISDSNKIPLEEGYFEIVLPGEFLEQSGDSFEIQWIDFYR